MNLPTLEQIDAELAKRSLSEFIRQAWHVVEPGQPYCHGWHIDAMAEHLEAVTSGQITRLLINVPPGMMKSLEVGVFWPSWEWGAKQLPHYRYIGASHSQSLAIRDNLKMRRLITSDWYQSRYGKSVTLMGDQNAKIKFENTATGFREAVAAGSITGSRGDRVLIDDPLSVEDAHSEVILKTREEWFLEAVPTRLNNPISSAIVVVMQRLDERDTSGLILAKELGYDHLMLPMEFEPHRKCKTSIGFTDPRTEEGELLFPLRFPREVVERDKKVMGIYAAAGQFQQRPAPADGGIIKLEWFTDKYYTDLPPIEYYVQSWDTAFKTGKENDYSVCTVWAIAKAGIYLVDRYKAKIEFPELKRMLITLANQHPSHSILVEDKASGQSLIQEMQRDTRLPIRPIKIDTDKLSRVHAVTTTLQYNVYLPANAPWLRDYIDNLLVFPNGAHDDDVDSTSQALNFIVTHRPRGKKDININVFGR